MTTGPAKRFKFIPVAYYYSKQMPLCQKN